MYATRTAGQASNTVFDISWTNRMSFPNCARCSSKFARAILVRSIEPPRLNMSALSMWPIAIISNSGFPII
jgi:hypothetical protein